MRTTLDIPDDLFRRVKATASLNGTSLRDFFTKAVEREVILQGHQIKTQGRRIILPLVPSNQPGTNKLSGERLGKLLEAEDIDVSSRH